LACAEELGQAISAAGYILLTGGTGPDDRSVKGRAIKGAGAARWVGVAQKGPSGTRKVNGGLVIRTGLGDKRNYLEARICDAAVALRGGEGTLSEITSALSVGRPVALVGKWRTDVDLDAEDRSAVLERIVRGAQTKLDNPPGNEEIDALIIQDVQVDALDPLPPYGYFELCEAAAVVRWIESVLPGPAPFAGEFPRIAGMERIASEYEQWLAEHAV
jgi:SLOG cluster4 family